MKLQSLLTEKKKGPEDFKLRKVNLWFYIFSISIFSSHLGFTSFIINPLIDTLIQRFNWDPDSSKLNIALLSTAPALGSFIGSFAGKYVLLFGRIRGLYLTNLIMIAGTLLTLTANLPIMILGRLL